MNKINFPNPQNRKILHVGDVHAVKEELEDCVKLIDLVIQVAKTNSIDVVLFEGDQYHTHAIMHVEVMHFWKKAFSKLKAEGLTPICIVGNHDMPGVDGSSAHAMLAHDEECLIVDSPTVLGGNILMMPYMSNHERLLEVCQEQEFCPTVLCHQTFVGGVYENGFFASDGIDANLIPQKHIISGHIHTPQEFGKVFYTGAPRWRTLSDANVERSIWVIHYKEDGTVELKIPFSTGNTCRQIRFAVDTPEKPVTLPLDTNHSWRIDIKGPAEWVEKRKRELSTHGVRIRTFSDAKSASTVRESEGIEKSFRKFLASFKARHGTSLEVLDKMAGERLGF